MGCCVQEEAGAQGTLVALPFDCCPWETGHIVVPRLRPVQGEGGLGPGVLPC